MQFSVILIVEKLEDLVGVANLKLHGDSITAEIKTVLKFQSQWEFQLYFELKQLVNY